MTGESKYGVLVEFLDGWRVLIVDTESFDVVFERACRDQEEAKNFASTVGQHIGWLSEEKFRRYYRLPALEGA